MELTKLRELLKEGVRQPQPPPDPFPFKSVPCEDGRPECRNTPTKLVASMTMYEWNPVGVKELNPMSKHEMADWARDKLKMDINYRQIHKTDMIRMILAAQEKQDPNRDRIMCQRCAEEYTELLKEQWAEYYHDRL